MTQETYTENSAGTGGTLYAWNDGTHTANINFVGNYVFENFKLSNDGCGGTLIIDPPVNSTEKNDSFNFDALRSPVSNVPNISGNLDHLELEHTLQPGIDQLQSLFDNAAGGQPHDLSGHAEGIQTVSVQPVHQDGIHSRCVLPGASHTRTRKTKTARWRHRSRVYLLMASVYFSGMLASMAISGGLGNVGLSPRRHVLGFPIRH